MNEPLVPPAPPPPLEDDAALDIRDLVADEIEAALRHREFAAKVPDDTWRRIVGHLCFLAALGLPVTGFMRITHAAWCLDLDHIKALGLGGMALLYGLPMIAAVAGGVTAVWMGSRLHMSTLVLEQVAMEKARSSANRRSRSAIWFPKSVRLGPVSVEASDEKD